MFRICKAEFKKLFLKPSIFVLAGILIFVLASCSFLYRPNTRPDTYISTAGITSVSSFYNKLNATGGGMNTFSYFEDNLKKAQSFIDSYKTEVDVKANLEQKLNSLVDETYANYMAEYRAYVAAKTAAESSGGTVSPARLNQAKRLLNNAFTELRNYYNANTKLINEKNIHVLTTNDLYLSTIEVLDNCISAFQNADDTYAGEDQVIDANRYIINQLSERIDFKTKLTKYFKELIPFTPNAEYVSSLERYVTETETRLGLIKEGTNYTHSTTDGLYSKIKSFNDECKATKAEDNDKDNIKKFQYLATCYKQSCENVLNIVSNGIYLNGLQKYSSSELSNFLGLSEFNFYEQKEEQTKLIYLFDTNTFEIDYAVPFSMDQPSNFKVNAFDFSYFALRLCMFIIVIYVITVAASTITGEQANGTLKMLAIRPYKRSKLLAGKLLSTLFIGILLIAVSAVATLAIGGITYGFASSKVLVVFNASSACAMSPVLLYFIYLLTLIVEMSFFLLLALAISMLFKSQIASVAISILIYFGTLVLNTLLGTAGWLRILPFTNINLYKYLGSSFLSHDTNFLRAIFTSPVAVGSSFWLSLIYTIVVMAGLAVTVFEVFKRRDIR